MLLIIKLGGAAISDKNSYRTAKPDAIAAIAAVIAAWRRKCDHLAHSLVIVHGAGSFGHFEAKEFQLNESRCDAGADRDRRLLGLCKCKASLAELHALVLRAFVDADVPVAAVPVFPSAEALYDRCMHLLSKGLIPVLHGDPVLDDLYHTRVVGGDTVALRLVQQHVQDCTMRGISPCFRVVFVTGVDGVFTACPATEPAAKLIRNVRVAASGLCSFWVASESDELREVSEASLSLNSTSGAADVTGGVAAKVRAAVDIVKAGGACDCSSHVIGAPNPRSAVVESSALEQLLEVLTTTPDDASLPTAAFLGVLGTHVLPMSDM